MSGARGAPSQHNNVLAITCIHRVYLHADIEHHVHYVVGLQLNVHI